MSTQRGFRVLRSGWREGKTWQGTGTPMFEKVGLGLRAKGPPPASKAPKGVRPELSLQGFKGNTLQIRKYPSSSRSEEHTSELQSRQYLVCRLLLEKKQINKLAQNRS